MNTKIRPCSCGNPRTKEWHLACAQCWDTIPKPLQDDVYHQYKTAQGSPEHIASVRRCYDAIHAARNGQNTALFGVFVTAKLKGEIYPLQGWVISESPLRIKCSDGTEYECEGTPTVVINPPDRTPASMVCECENPGPHMKPGAGGKFCAVCGWDIPPNASVMARPDGGPNN